MNYKSFISIICLAIGILAIISVIFGIPEYSNAHPGRTDSSGCHTCRTNCASWGLSTGEYHCHRSKGVVQPEEPIKSHRGTGGTGWTEPAPEYKEPEYKEPEYKPNYQTAQASDTESSSGSWIWWAIGIGIAGLIGYNYFKKK